MKRKLALIGSASLMALATSYSTVATAQAKQAAGVTTITFLSTLEPGHGRSYFMQNVFKPAFEKAYPNIHLNVIIVPWDQYDTKLNTMFAAGTAPDVWSDWGSSGFGDYFHRGLALDLSSLIKKTGWKNPNIPASLMNVYNVKGQQYALPLGWFPSFVFYNKSLVQQAGVTIPNYKWNDPRWTWAQMVATAKKLTKNYGTPAATYGYFNDDVFLDNLGLDWGSTMYTNNVYKDGYATDTTIGQSKFIQAITAYQDLIYKDKVSPTPAVEQGIAPDAGDPFMSGRIAMETNGSFLLGNALQNNIQLGILPYPKGPAGTATSIKYTDPLMISKTSKHVQAAWDLITFLDSTPMQKAYLDTTGNLPADQVAAKGWYSKFTSIGVSASRLQTLTNQALANSKESFGNVLAGYSQIYTFLTNSTQPIFENDQSPAKVLPTLTKPLNAILAKVKHGIKQ